MPYHLHYSVLDDPLFKYWIEIAFTNSENKSDLDSDYINFNKSIFDIVIWLRDNFGAQAGGRYACDFTRGDLELWFASEGDAMLFKLTWG
jgi:hypothetical protein